MSNRIISIGLGTVLLLSAIGGYVLVQRHQHQERLKQALARIQGVDDRPQVERDFENYKLNGIVEFNRSQFADAVQHFVTALSLKPEDVEVRTLIVSAYKKSGSYDLAEEFLLESLKLLPENSELLTQLGYVYLESGNLEKARTVFQNLVDSKIDLLEGYEGLAEVEVKQRNYDKAIQYFRSARPFRERLIDEAKEKGKITRSFYRFASLFKEAGHPELAEVLFRKVLEFEPMEVNAYIELAKIYEYLKQKDHAQHYYNAFLKIAGPLDQEKIDFAKQRLEALTRDEFLPPPPVVPLQ